MQVLWVSLLVFLLLDLKISLACDYDCQRDSNGSSYRYVSHFNVSIRSWTNHRCSDRIFVWAITNYKNTYTGIVEVDANIKDAGKGMGMTSNQVLRMIELPLSLSVIIGGIRIALVVAVGIVAIGSFIGAPTLGDIIIRGTNSTDGTAFILAGAIPIALIAILIDIGLRMLERKLDPTQKKKVHNLKQLINTPASKYINLLAGFYSCD